MAAAAAAAATAAALPQFNYQSPNQTFAISLYQRLAQEYPGQNIIFSPFSFQDSSGVSYINDNLKKLTIDGNSDTPFLRISKKESERNDWPTTLDIQIQGKWLYNFNKIFNLRQPFWTSSSTYVDVDMMSSEMLLFTHHLDNLRTTCIQLPFENLEIFMLILLPDFRDDIQHLEWNLHTLNFMQLINNMTMTRFNEVRIPKFNAEFSINLNEILQADMRTMFPDNYSFFNEHIGNKEDSPHKNIFHKVSIDVKEAGLIAVVSKDLGVNGYHYGPPRFIADHPFFYAIMNQNDLLFLGRYIEPNITQPKRIL